MRRLSPLAATSAALLLLSGCATVSDRGYWGAGVGWPDAGRLRDAAVSAARDPQTWVPLTGALILSLGDLDEEVSDWASEKTPLFGGDAKRASDHLRNLNTLAYFTTALTAPSDTTASRARGLGVGVATLVLEQGTVSGIKSLSDRQRPDGSDDRSFPSGHTSRASVSAAMAAENLNYFGGIPDWARGTLQIGLYGTAAATGWARVEAGKHYPTDVLVGYAIGQFLARFMVQAFFVTGTQTDPQQSLSYRALPGGGELSWSMSLP